MFKEMNITKQDVEKNLEKLEKHNVHILEIFETAKERFETAKLKDQEEKVRLLEMIQQME
jgi:hypothetical protein